MQFFPPVQGDYVMPAPAQDMVRPAESEEKVSFSSMLSLQEQDLNTGGDGAAPVSSVPVDNPAKMSAEVPEQYGETENSVDPSPAEVAGFDGENMDETQVVGDDAAAADDMEPDLSAVLEMLSGCLNGVSGLAKGNAAVEEAAGQDVASLRDLLAQIGEVQDVSELQGLLAQAAQSLQGMQERLAELADQSASMARVLGRIDAVLSAVSDAVRDMGRKTTSLPADAPTRPDTLSSMVGMSAMARAGSGTGAGEDGGSSGDQSASAESGSRSQPEAVGGEAVSGTQTIGKGVPGGGSSGSDTAGVAPEARIGRPVVKKAGAGEEAGEGDGESAGTREGGAAGQSGSADSGALRAGHGTVAAQAATDGQSASTIGTERAEKVQSAHGEKTSAGAASDGQTASTIGTERAEKVQSAHGEKTSAGAASDGQSASTTGTERAEKVQSAHGEKTSAGAASDGQSAPTTGTESADKTRVAHDTKTSARAAAAGQSETASKAADSDAIRSASEGAETDSETAPVAGGADAARPASGDKKPDKTAGSQFSKPDGAGEKNTMKVMAHAESRGGRDEAAGDGTAEVSDNTSLDVQDASEHGAGRNAKSAAAGSQSLSETGAAPAGHPAVSKISEQTGDRIGSEFRVHTAGHDVRNDQAVSAAGADGARDGKDEDAFVGAKNKGGRETGSGRGDSSKRAQQSRFEVVPDQKVASNSEAAEMVVSRQDVSTATQTNAGLNRMDAQTRSAEVYSQVENGAFKNLGQGSRQLVLRLDPENLGQVNVILQVRGKEVRAVLRTTTHEAGHALSEQMAQLKTHLENQGLKVAKLEVQTQLADSQTQSQWQSADQHNQQQEFREMAMATQRWRTYGRAESAVVRDVQVVPQRENNSRTGLDIFA